MPSCAASAVPRDPEAWIAAWIVALIALTRDRCPYIRADGICSSYSYVIQRTPRIILEVEKMRQVNQPLKTIKVRGAADGIKPGVERSGTPGTAIKNNQSPRSGRQSTHYDRRFVIELLSAASRALQLFGSAIPGFRFAPPRALC